MASINKFKPIQEGTGTPSPDNIRPILPAVSIAGGKNLFKLDSTLKRGNAAFIALEETDTGVVIGDSMVNGGYLVKVKPNTTYTFSYDAEYVGSNMHIRVWKGDSSNPPFIVNQERANTATFTTDSETDCIRCGFYAYSSYVYNTTISNIQLEEGSVRTEYEPYQTLDIYGGSIDIVNNTITEEYSIIDKPWSEWILHGNQTNTTRKYLEHTSEVYQSGEWSYYISMCNVTTFSFSWSENDNPHFYHSTHTRAFVWLPNDYDETVQVQVLGRLCTPIIHTLTPTQLAQAMDQLGIRLSSTLIDARRKIILNSPHLEIISNRMASFNTDMKAPLKDCKISFVPVQEGSGNASPTNIRPITGWTGINVEYKGKNLYDASTYPLTSGWIHGYLGDRGGHASYKCTADFVPLNGLDGKTITLNKRPGGSNPGIAFYSNNTYTSFISGVTNGGNTAGTPMTVTVPNGTKYMRFTVPADATDIQIELGNTATEYEDYNGTTIPISWESDLGTIYGGYVDLLKGELIEEWKEVDLGSLSWSEFYNYNVYSATITDMVSAMRTQTVMAENYKFYSATESVINMPDKSIKNHDSNNSVYVKDTDYTTSSDVSAFKTAMAGMKIVYKLATPITYQLTPQQLKSLKCINNIWSDTNDTIEVKYWTH